MNEVIKCIQERRGVKEYLDKPVEKEVIEQIMEAGLYAPSARGTQSPVFIAISNKEVFEKLRAANAAHSSSVTGDPFYGAKQVIVVLVDKNVAKTPVIDGALAAQNIMLAAKSLGVASRWINRAKEVFEMDEWKAWLKEQGLDGDYEGVANVIIGYPANEPAAAERVPDRIFFVD